MPVSPTLYSPPPLMDSRVAVFKTSKRKLPWVNPTPTRITSILNTAHDILSQCETLFAAINEIEEIKNPEAFKLRRIRGLAEIGASISWEWSNQFDVSRESLRNFIAGKGGES